MSSGLQKWCERNRTGRLWRNAADGSRAPDAQRHVPDDAAHGPPEDSRIRRPLAGTAVRET